MKSRLRTLLTTYARITGALVRVLLLLVLTLGLLVFGVTKSAVAKMDNGMMDMGRHLLGLAESGLGDNGTQVLLNGQTLGFRAFSVDHNVKTVLDFYEAWCRGGVDDFSRQESTLRGVNQGGVNQTVPPRRTLRLKDVDVDLGSLKAPPSDRSWRDLTMRNTDGKFGFVACIKHGIPKISADELAERALRFFQDGNLSILGMFHYVAVTQVGSRTRVVAVWTQGDFYPATMFPPKGDAPGFDASHISRPPTGRRMLSAGQVGNSENLIIYVDSQQSLAQLGTFYRRDFLAQGWRILADRRESSLQHFFVVQRGGEMRMVSLSRESGEPVSVTIVSTS